MLFIDSSVFFTLAMLPERLGVAGTLQNPRTREEESAWGWLGNLVHEGSDAARYWDPGCSCVGCHRPAFSCALFLRSIRPHSASSSPTPLMSADEDQPVSSLEWGLNLTHPGARSCLLVPSGFPLRPEGPVGWGKVLALRNKVIG